MILVPATTDDTGNDLIAALHSTENELVNQARMAWANDTHTRLVHDNPNASAFEVCLLTTVPLLACMLRRTPEEETELADLEATRTADERAWADILKAKGGGPGRVRCERRIELAAATTRTPEEETELADLEATRLCARYPHARRQKLLLPLGP